MEKRGIGRLRYSLLCVGVLAQLVTVLITWPLWQVRSGGVPNLPVFDVPEFSFGIMVCVSTLLVLLIPKPGIWINLAVLALATAFDQMRAQPQFLANWVLMFAVVAPYGSSVVRLFLASLWFWAGLHKFLSPEWFANVSWGLIQKSNLNPEHIYLMFAWVVACSELGLGLMAWLKPRWAAVFCPLVHVGIVIFLSPMIRDWNYSVIPWNLATAIVGCWVLFDVSLRKKAEASSGTRFVAWECCVLAVFMAVPAGFYVGWVDHGYAHVLYSSNIPRGIISKLDGSNQEIVGWGELAVPFPNERRLLKQYFTKSAEVGEKLHIRDPRTALEDQYFIMTLRGPREITAPTFYRKLHQEAIGIGVDSNRNVFLLGQAGARMLKRDENAMIYAIEFSPESFSPALMSLLPGLPNLEQIQLSNTAVTDADLYHLLTLQRLEAVILYNTAITERGIELLNSIPSVSLIQHDQE